MTDWPWMEGTENWPAWLREAWHKAHFGATATTTDIRYALRLLAQAAGALKHIGLDIAFHYALGDPDLSSNGLWIDDYRMFTEEAREEVKAALVLTRGVLARIRAGSSGE